MSSDSQDAADDDHALFRLALSGVRLAPPSSRVAEHRSVPAPQPRQRHADDLAVLREMLEDPDPELLEHGETLSYRHAGVQDSVLRRLRRGHYRLEAELDLHGHNRERAKLALAQFLSRCLDRDLRCVRIIHGKGRGGGNEFVDSRGLPVLKNLVDRMLRQRADVLAFHSAPAAQGGTGAVLVLLGRRRPA